MADDSQALGQLIVFAGRSLVSRFQMGSSHHIVACLVCSFGCSSIRICLKHSILIDCRTHDDELTSAPSLAQSIKTPSRVIEYERRFCLVLRFHILEFGKILNFCLVELISTTCCCCCCSEENARHLSDHKQPALQCLVFVLSLLINQLIDFTHRRDFRWLIMKREKERFRWRF